MHAVLTYTCLDTCVHMHSVHLSQHIYTHACAHVCSSRYVLTWTRVYTYAGACMHVCGYIHTSNCVHTCHVHTHVCMHTRSHTYTCAPAHVCACISAGAYMCVDTCMQRHTCVHLYAGIRTCVYTHSPHVDAHARRSAMLCLHHPRLQRLWLPFLLAFREFCQQLCSPWGQVTSAKAWEHLQMGWENEGRAGAKCHLSWQPRRNWKDFAGQSYGAVP